jgi:hypothetical protein
MYGTLVAAFGQCDGDCGGHRARLGDHDPAGPGQHVA